MALTFTTTDRASYENGIKSLIYGESGSGKTTLCGTAPDPIILSAEAGLLALRRKSIPVIEIKTMTDLEEAYLWLLKAKEAEQFQTACLDSLSEIGEVVLATEIRRAKDPRQAYGELITKMTQLIRSFRDLPRKHVVMLAKVEPFKDEMTGIVKYGPSMPGNKLSPQLPYFFDQVYRLGVAKTPEGKPYRFIQTELDLQHVAKDRSGSLAAIEPPDLTHIFNKILGG